MGKEHIFPPDVPQTTRRMHRTKKGYRKRMMTEHEAKTAAHKLQISAYVCPTCGWWHVGDIGEKR